jgi:predicted DNA-binding transcriptional regulator YafY
MSNLSRITYIDETIRKRGFVTRKEVAEEFEVHIDTVKRDIEYMRLFLKAPLKYSAANGGYVYCEPFETVFSATEDAVLYYIFIHRITDCLKLDGAPYIPVISKDIVEKILSYIPEEYEPVFDSIAYDSSDLDEMDINHFRNILRSIKNRKILEIEYCNAKGEKSQRPVEPLLLNNYLGKWYIAAYCHQRKSLATFLISRIISSKVTEKNHGNSATRKELKEYTGGAFGMFKSSSTKNAVIRIYEPAMYYVINQKWHKDQTVTQGDKDGTKYIEITLPIGERHSEIIARVLSYSPDSEIISPPELRENWLETIRKMYERHLSGN